MMSVAEMAEAERAIDSMVLALPTRSSRRFAAAPAWPPVLQTHPAADGAPGRPAAAGYEQRLRKPRPIVVICDIWGPLDAIRGCFFAANALTQRRGNVHSFLFGTQLNVSLPDEGP